MTTPQIILFLDQNGSLRAETAGRNGSRRKIELPQGAIQQIGAILAELNSQRIILAAEQQRLDEARQIQRVDPEIERQNKIEHEKQERTTKWNAWLDSLPIHERERQIAIRDAKIAHIKEAELERAKSVWWGMANSRGQGPAFANSIITDPKRRPRVAKTILTQAQPKRDTQVKSPRPLARTPAVLSFKL